MLNVEARSDKLNLNNLMNNEKEDSTEEINSMATFISIKMSHIFKDSAKGEYYIDEVCKKAKELYQYNLTHSNESRFVIREAQLK